MSVKTVALLIRSYYSGTKPMEQLFQTVSAKALGKSASRTRKTLRVIGTVLLALLVAFSFVMIMLMLGINYYSFQQMGILIGIPDLGLFISQILGCVLVFIFACLGAGSTLYRGKDMSLLMTLPVTKTDLLASRFVLLYLSMLPFYCFVTLPGIVIVWGYTQATVPLFVGGLLSLLLGPILPVALGALLGMSIMRIAKGRNNKVAIELISILAVTAIVLFAQGNVMRMSGVYPGSDPQQLIESLAATVSGAYKALMYFALQSAMVFSVGGIVNPYLAMLVNITLSCIFAGLTIWILSGSFSMCVSLAQNGANKNRRRSLTQQKYTKRKHRRGLFEPLSPMISIAMKDWDIIRGTSTFLIELLGEIFIPVILVGIYAISGALGDMQELVSMLATSPWFAAGVCGTLLLVLSFTMVSATSISREGVLFAISRTWPVSAKQHVNGKLFLHMVLVFIPYVIYLGICAWIFSIEAIHLPWGLLLGFFTIFGTGAVDLAIDYARPNLDWKLPQQAVKQNLNGVIGMGMSIVYLIVLAASVLLPGLVFKVPVIVCMYIGTAVSVVLACIGYAVAVSMAKKAYLPQ